jgi:hypothetical protein
MPKTWSNREIGHIDVHPRHKGGLPFTGWMIIGFAMVGLCIFTYLAVNICIHPIQTPVDESAPISQTH